jgi:ribosomal protein S18 acetylase RimI-like enzyme
MSTASSAPPIPPTNTSNIGPTTTNIAISHPTPLSLPSLSTIHTRSFHPLPYHKWHRSTFPDTPAMRAWWSTRYSHDISDPDCIVLSASSTTSPNDVLAVIVLRKYDETTRGAGTWTMFERCEDQPREAYEDMLRSMIEGREKFMLGKPHYHIEHFAVDFEVQRLGVGKKLIAAACEIVDREFVEVFVQTNEFAAAFYERVGFREVGREGVSGGVSGGMDEVLLIRGARGKV